MRVMRTSILFILLALLQTEPSNAAFNSSPVSLPEELGCSPTLSKIFQTENLYFDPLGLATDDNFSRFREAELKHGRVAMIAFVWSWISFVPMIMGTNGNENADPENRVAVVVVGHVLQQKQLPPVLELWHDRWAPSDFYKFIAICGLLETVVLVQVNPQDMPGDYGLAYFGVRDKGRNEQSLISELENGRLAMLVMLYYAIHDFQAVNTLESFPLRIANWLF